MDAQEAVGQGWTTALHPEDRQRIIAAWQEAVRNTTHFDQEYRSIRPDGIVLWVHTQAAAIRHKDTLLGYMGVVENITARRSAEEMMRHGEAQLQAIVETAVDGIVTINAQGMILSFNPAASHIFGYLSEEALGSSISLLMPEGDASAHGHHVAHYLETGEKRIIGLGREVAAKRKDGTIFPMELSVSHVREGEMDLFVGIMRDITERKQYEQQIQEANAWLEKSNDQLTEHQVELVSINQQMERQMLVINAQAVELEAQKRELEMVNTRLEMLATMDGLTGIKNHRAFQEQLMVEYERSRRYGKPLSVLLMDVDKFKRFNDSFGHPAGDQVLRQVASAIQNEARSSDFVARYGGEEFAVLLPEANAEEAMVAAERIRAAVAGQGWELREVTISIGVATMLPATESAAQLIEGADKALYASKASGRNRVTHAGVEGVELAYA